MMTFLSTDINIKKEINIKKLKVQGHGKGPGPCWTFGKTFLVVYGQSAIDHDHEKIKLLRPHFVEPGGCLMNQNLSVLVKVNSQYYIWFR